jgi:fructokinase
MMTTSAPLLAGIEAGGTKFLCAVGTGPDDLRAQARIPTTTPDRTLAEVRAFLEGARAAHGPFAALGIACFGPVDLDRASPTWGRILATPKAGWSGADVAGALGAALGVPVAFDTDVDGAAVAEGRWGAGRGMDPFVYLTVGTGIGGGAVVHGRPLHGLGHPEMGHLPVPHDRVADPFPGCCPFHGDCLEGVASGTAIAARWGRPAPELLDRPEVWDLEAAYLGAAVASIVWTLSPRRVIVGGGVGGVPGLLARVRAAVSARLGGYLVQPAVSGDLRDFVVAPALGDQAGVLGALALAADLAGRIDTSGGGGR